jgi:hypothetical protein
MSAEQEHTHHMRIHIDQHPYESPNSITGAELYLLGKVKTGINGSGIIDHEAPFSGHFVAVQK